MGEQSQWRTDAPLTATNDTGCFTLTTVDHRPPSGDTEAVIVSMWTRYWRVSLLVSLAATVPAGCSPSEPSSGPTTVQSATQPAPTTKESVDREAPPPREPPPAIEGTIAVEGPDLYVERCGSDYPCPALLFDAGKTRCETLSLGDAGGWRLPTRSELERMARTAGLQGPTGYHWTGTPYSEDAGQSWIVARDGSQSTTIPHSRKPFAVRCVRPFPVTP